MPANITTLKIRKNGTMKITADYDSTAFASSYPGQVIEITAATGQAVLATGVTSSLVKGLLVEKVTINEDQNNVSLLADQAEVAVGQNALVSGIEFTIGQKVYHNAAAKLTNTSGAGNFMGVSLSHVFSNSGSDLIMVTRSMEENV